eukprot:TRINITY_DN75059_c0_g1_i1.p1 TRINITY_DN75059_c0_g1~~TRINITY_DN75059_c0_g1_i1.p1  ORF type:complete len:816 (-),score=114.57 TRINITY_DN75059_c0_g1_i1:41-2416(-)
MVPLIDDCDLGKPFPGAKKFDCKDTKNTDVCFVFPLQTDGNTKQFDEELKGTEEKIRQRARRLFRREHDFDACFGKQGSSLTKGITFREYSNIFRQFLIRHLQGHHCGFYLKKRTSIDGDEAFLMIQLPSERMTCKEMGIKTSVTEHLAARLGLRHQLKEEAYIKADLKMEKTHHGLTLPAVHRVTLELAGEDSPFQDFSSKDVLRIIHAMLDEALDLTVVLEHNLVSNVFPVHKYHESIGFADKSLWLKAWSPFPLCLSSDSDEAYFEQNDMICNYFGEEIGFFFLFLAENTKQMRILAIGSVFMIFRVFAGNLVVQRCIQTGFAFLVAFWSGWARQAFGRRENEWISHWSSRSMDQGVAAVHKLNNYEKEKNKYSTGGFGFIQVQLWRCLASIAFVLTMLAIMVGIAYIEFCRVDVTAHPNSFSGSVSRFLFTPLVALANAASLHLSVSEIGARAGAMLITLQIRLFDFLWDSFARYVVTKENHRTKQEMTSSLIYKLFAVKIFNCMYPFIFIGFIKKRLYGSCLESSDAEGGCIVQLQQSLATLFVSNAIIDVLLVFIDWFRAKKKMDTEMIESDRPYSHIEAQAKLVKPWEVLDDMLVFVSQFTFVCCFTVAWPFLPVCALIYNVVMGKLYMARRLYVQQRNFPILADGIGVWKDILRGSIVLAVVMNAALVSFAMHPVVDFEPVTQVLCFLCVEHGLLGIFGFMTFWYPLEEPELAASDEFNHEYAPRIADPQHSWHRGSVPAENLTAALSELELACHDLAGGKVLVPKQEFASVGFFRCGACRKR